MFDGRTNHAQAVLRAIRESYELPIIEPPIPKTIKFAEAPAIGRSILGTSKSHKGAEAYRQVAAFLLNGARPAS
jgi:chromosome partitioning protein